MRITAHEIGVSGMLRQDSHRLVEDDLRQYSSVDVGKEFFAVLEMSGAIGGARRKSLEIVERLMVRLEIRGAVLARVDDLAPFVRRLAAVG
jgi:hypothetical protein